MIILSNLLHGILMKQFADFSYTRCKELKLQFRSIVAKTKVQMTLRLFSHVSVVTFFFFFKGKK